MIQEFGDSTQVRPDVQTLIAFIVTLQLRVIEDRNVSKESR